MDISQLVHASTETRGARKPAIAASVEDCENLIRLGDVTKLEVVARQWKAEGNRLPVQRMLQVALKGHDVEILQFCFEQGAVIEPSSDAIKPSEKGRPLDFFRELVKHGWPAGPRGLTNNLSHGHEVVELLLAHGQIVTVPCLLAAIRTGDTRVLATLLHNIDLRAKVPAVEDYEKAIADPKYLTSVAMCCEEPSLQRIIDQACLLPLAALYQEADMVRYLLSLQASVDLLPVADKFPEGVNGCALHKAVSSTVVGRIPQPDLVQVLLDAGADPLLKDDLGRTALQINEHWGHISTKEHIRNLLRGRMGPHG